MDATNDGSIKVNNSLDTTIKIQNDEVHNLFNYSANLNLQHTFKDNEKLLFNADYMYYRDYNPVTYLNSWYRNNGALLYDENVKSKKLTPITFWIGTLDYSKKLGKKIDLEAGIKGTLSRFTNDVEVSRLVQNAWIRDGGLTAKYKLDENITAAYASANLSIDDKNSLKMGLRYEYTNSNLGTETIKNMVDRHYGKLFPSFFLNHKINDDNAVNLSYSRRITRPTFNDMAPFVIFIDPNTFFSGNPALQPSISDAVNAAYTFKKYLFSCSYSYEDGSIANFSPRVDPVTNKQTLAAKTCGIPKHFLFPYRSRWMLLNGGVCKIT